MGVEALLPAAVVLLVTLAGLTVTCVVLAFRWAARGDWGFAALAAWGAVVVGVVTWGLAASSGFVFGWWS